MSIKDFEKRYLGKLVKVRFKQMFIKSTLCWFDYETEYIGHLEKSKTLNGNYYYLKEHVYKGELWSSCFSKNAFASIILVK